MKKEQKRTIKARVKRFFTDCCPMCGSDAVRDDSYWDCSCKVCGAKWREEAGTRAQIGKARQ